MQCKDSIWKGFPWWNHWFEQFHAARNTTEADEAWKKFIDTQDERLKKMHTRYDNTPEY